MVQSHPEVRRWLRHAHGHGRVYLTAHKARSGVWTYQFYTVSPQGLSRLDPGSALHRHFDWNALRGAFISTKSEKSLLLELAQALGWREWKAPLEVLR